MPIQDMTRKLPWLVAVLGVVVLGVVALGILLYYYHSTTPHKEETVVLNKTYDYIIVGAGSAGSVLANRLSEDLLSTVLVVEAGGSEDENPTMHIPAIPASLQHTKQDWAFKTVPQKTSSFGLQENRSAWPRGKVLGGSSSINYMHHIRGSRHDFDGWAKEGCQGWSYRDVLPYFIKSEDIQIPRLQNSAYHGRGGPLTVSDGLSSPLGNEVYRRGMEELGYQTVDCNGPSQTGFCYGQETVKDGERCSTAKAFLRPAMGRSNLHVTTNSYVTKILIENKTAVGISFIKDNIKHDIKANKEVIVSSGSVNSPQILMLSGIGPKNHLASLKIPVVADLPVGDNLEEHVMMPLLFQENTSSSFSPTPLSFQQYRVNRSGNLSKTHIEGDAFFGDDRKKPPYFQVSFYSARIAPEIAKDFTKMFNWDTKMTEEKSNEYKVILEKAGGTFFAICVLLHPKSRGTIRLQSTDPFDPPLIDPNYFNHPDDMKEAIKGIRETLNLANTTAFRSVGASPSDPYDEYFPPCNSIPYSSEDYWICRYRYHMITMYHATSTCRMGDQNDNTTVVDPELRVKGIGNLRVVDASVMRHIVSGNTNANVIMIAEKAADLIRGIDSVKNIRNSTENL